MHPREPINQHLLNYTGPSMNPILRTGDRLNISPYDGQKIRRGDVIVFISPEDGSKVVGLFNIGFQQSPVQVSFSDLGIKGEQLVRDLWRQKDLGTFKDRFQAKVPAHGVVLVKITPASKGR